MTVIVQDDHLTAGAWAACGYINASKFEIFSISKRHAIHCSKYFKGKFNEMFAFITNVKLVVIRFYDRFSVG